MNDKKIRLALLGASRIAARVLPYINAVSEIEVVGVAASSLDRAKEFSREQGLTKAYASYDHALNQADIDAVYISVLSSDHFALIKKSLMANKHVLCEKPIVLTAIEASEITALALSKNLVLLEGFMYRFHPHIKFLQDHISSGSIGEIKSLQLSFSFLLGTQGRKRGLRSGGGGALNDLGSYLIDFATLILGTKDLPQITSHANLNSKDLEAVDEKFTAVLEYPDGIFAMLDASVSTVSSNLWEIRGTKGSVGVLRFDPQGVSEEGAPAVTIQIDEDSNAKITPVSSNGNSMEQFQLEFQNFAFAILKKSDPFISLDEIRFKTQILENIRINFQS